MLKVVVLADPPPKDVEVLTCLSWPSHCTISIQGGFPALIDNVLAFFVQFRRRNGYVAFVYSKEGLNFDGQGKAAEGEDSDALDLKEEDAVKKLKGLYARYLKGYVESTLGEEGDEGDTESEDDESDWGSGGDGKPDEGEQNEREKKTDGWEETDSGEEQTDQEAETESSLSGGVDSEELEFLKGDEVEHLSGWQEDYLRWAEESEVPPHEAPPRRARVQKAHLAERSGAQKATGPEQETARRTNGRSEPPEQPESDRPASDPFGDPEEADKLSFGVSFLHIFSPPLCIIQ